MMHSLLEQLGTAELTQPAEEARLPGPPADSSAESASAESAVPTRARMCERGDLMAPPHSQPLDVADCGLAAEGLQEPLDLLSRGIEANGEQRGHLLVGSVLQLYLRREQDQADWSIKLLFAARLRMCSVTAIVLQV